MPCHASSGYAPISRIGLIAEGETAAGDILATDGSWQARTADWIAATDLVISLPTGPQEHFDARRAPANWKTAPPTDGWSEAFVLGPVGTPPWRSLTPRPVPLLTETLAAPPLVWRGTGPPDAAPVGDNLAAKFNALPLSGGPCEDLSVGWIDAAAGDVFVFDLGRTRMIRPGLEVREVSGDVRVECFYATALGDRPQADGGFGSAIEGATDSVTPQGVTAWEALHGRGMRFVTVRIAGSGTCRWKLAAKTVEYPFAAPKTLATDDPELARIWEVSQATIRSSTDDVYVDCCSREDTLWTFDACVTGEAAFRTFGEQAMWRRCLALIAQGIDEQGYPKSVVPSDTSFMCLVDQAHVWLISCLRYAEATGDDSLTAEIADAAHRLIAMCAAHVTADGLYAPPPSSWHFVDWAPIDRRPYSLPANALLVVAADAAAKLGQRIGHADLLREATALAETLRPNLAAFYEDAEGSFRSHLAAATEPRHVARVFSGPETVPYAIHGTVLAVLAGAGTPAQRGSAMRHVAGLLDAPLGPANKFGPGWTNLLLDPLFDYGHGDAALAFVKRVYGQFLAVDAPTWGEGFGPSRYNSAHGWGSTVNTLLAKRVGVR
jgi:hypothetical protein